MFQKIMVATDGSPTSLKAGSIGVNLAALSKAQVVAVFVADTARLDSVSSYLIFSGVRDWIKEGIIRSGQEAVDQICAIARKSGVSCRGLVVEGRPADQILKLSVEDGADLLVLGSIGRGGIGRFMLGSVAEKVVQHCKVPVLTVPGDAQPEQTDDTEQA